MAKEGYKEIERKKEVYTHKGVSMWSMSMASAGMMMIMIWWL